MHFNNLEHVIVAIISLITNIDQDKYKGNYFNTRESNM